MCQLFLLQLYIIVLCKQTNYILPLGPKQTPDTGLTSSSAPKKSHQKKKRKKSQLFWDHLDQKISIGFNNGLQP